MVFESGKRGVLKNFLKKVSEKFGGYKKTLYLCTTFALIKQREGKNEEGRMIKALPKTERESRKA